MNGFYHELLVTARLYYTIFALLVPAAYYGMHEWIQDRLAKEITVCISILSPFLH